MNALGPMSIGGFNPAANLQEMRDRSMAMIDADQNGKVSFEEIESTERGAQIADKLRAFDTDNSGDLSTEEISEIQQQVADKIREKVQAAGFSGVNTEALFNALYANKDD